MNKLEKILAQTVTSEMVADHLTEKEIEETINEINEEKNSVEDYIQFKKEEIAEHEGYIKTNEKLIARSKEEKKRAITRFKQLNRIEESFRVALSEIKSKAPSPNEQRARLIEEAKEYIRTNSEGIKSSVNKKRRTITLGNGELWYSPDLVWNKYIAKALAVAYHNADDDYIYKFGSNAPQPTEIVEGMDVELSGVSRKFYASGRTISYCEERDAVTFSSIYETGENVHIYSGEEITGVRTDGFKITGDTKAKYKEEDK